MEGRVTGLETLLFFLIVVGVAIALTRSETRRECEREILSAMSEFYGHSVPELRARVNYQKALRAAPCEESL